MTQYGFMFDMNRCYACQACSIACKDWNDIEPGAEKWMTVYEWEKGTFPNIRLNALAFPCAHCEDPSCMKVCPNGAIYKEDEFGAVLVDQDKCEGCRKCYEACPYGSPKFASDEQGAKMSKCTMCVDRLAEGMQPACPARRAHREVRRRAPMRGHARAGRDQARFHHLEPTREDAAHPL